MSPHKIREIFGIAKCESRQQELKCAQIARSFESLVLELAGHLPDSSRVDDLFEDLSDLSLKAQKIFMRGSEQREDFNQNGYMPAERNTSFEKSRETYSRQDIAPARNQGFPPEMMPPAPSDVEAAMFQEFMRLRRTSPQGPSPLPPPVRATAVEMPLMEIPEGMTVPSGNAGGPIPDPGARNQNIAAPREVFPAGYKFQKSKQEQDADLLMNQLSSMKQI